jgi:LmbE family N-acetylglucosaminyl deacetylase
VTTILVAAAHPDDETLGCGGTMLRHARTGNTVHVAFFADGETSRGGRAAKKVAGRRAQAAAACNILGAKSPHFFDFPDNRMDTVSMLDLAKAVEQVIATVKPAIIYTHHAHDLNVDHRLVHQAVMTACRPQPGSNVRAIYAFEVASSTGWAGPTLPQFSPARFVNIEQQWTAKRQALRYYADEMRTFPHVRSFEAIEALARYRGASVGLPMAEAFEVLRDVIAGD